MERPYPLSPRWLLLPLGALYFCSMGRMVVLHAVAPETRVRQVVNRFDRAEVSEAPRAPLLDRAGRPLAASRPEWRLLLDQPPQYRRYTRGDAGSAASSLDAEMAPVAAAAGVRLEELRSLLLSEKSYSAVAGGLSHETALRLQALLEAAPGTGLRLQRYWDRVYPQGRVLAHLVGYLEEAGPGQAPRGACGLEKMCEALLLGGPGQRRSLRVGRGYGVNPALDATPPRPAAPVQTTCDVVVSQLLREALLRLQEEHRPEWCAGVVLDARNGEILALAGLPDFDPNDPAAAFAGAQGGRGLAFPGNWAIEPGSTFKPFVMARALEAGLVDRGELFTQGENDAWSYEGRVLHNVPEVPDEPLDWHGVIVHSSNIGIAQVGLRLGGGGLQRLLEDFGFWEPAGLPGVEGPCRTPSAKDWKSAKYTVVSASFGRDFSTTPVRLAAAFAAIANGGVLHAPRLIQGQQVAPSRRVLSPQVCAELRAALHDVVELPSRKQLHDPEMAWAGKSGTVDKFNDHSSYRSLFAGYAPAPEPRYVVVVVADGAQTAKPYGAKVAGPAVRSVLRETLRWYGLLPAAPPAAAEPGAPLE